MHFIIPLFLSAPVLAAFIIALVRLRPIVKKKPSLPSFGYRLFYSDQKTENRDRDVIYSKLLVSEKHGLSGKPDFIYVKNRAYLPVELKSGSIGDSPLPRDGDLMQLAAYFLIIEDLYGTKPKHGRLIYNDHMFIIRNTAALRARLRETLGRMRRVLATGEGFSKADAGFSKCRHCICCGTVCEI